MKYLSGSVIVIRDGGDPELHYVPLGSVLPDAAQMADRGPGSEWVRQMVYRNVFGAGRPVSAVLAVTPVPVAAQLAETYQGPGAEMVRALAALVALGEPIPSPDDTGPGRDGGARDRLPDGPAPIKPAPRTGTPVA